MYNRKLDEEICQRIAEGETLLQICKDPRVPSYRKVLNWRNDSEGFFRLYILARVDAADHMGDRIIELIDKVESGRLEPHVGRTAIDGLNWLMAKLHPERYGERIATIHFGSVQLESVKNHAPKWMQEALAAHATAAKEPEQQAKDEEDATVH